MKQTRVFDMKTALDRGQLSEAAELLKAGKTVAFPTETVYGLGAYALDETALSAIYEAKGRPSDNPLIVHIVEMAMLDDLIAEKKPYVDRLIEAFWPGPLTLVFKKKSNVPLKVTGGLDTVAIRMPAHPIAKALIETAGIPVAAPSANLSGKPSPTVGKYVVEDLMGRVDGIVDGGDVSYGLESTVLDVTGETPMILRPGKVTQKDIASVVGSCDVDPAIASNSASVAVAKSPGMKYRHYAPEAQVTVFTGDTVKVLAEIERRVIESVNAGHTVGVMAFEQDWAFLSKLLERSLGDSERERVHFYNEGSAKAPEVFAQHLFKHLREADEDGCDELYVRGVSEEGIGSAIMNRLSKASEGRVFKI